MSRSRVGRVVEARKRLLAGLRVLTAMDMQKFRPL